MGYSKICIESLGNDGWRSALIAKWPDTEKRLK